MSFIWKLTRNKYIRFAFYLLERIGIKKTKSFVYMINLENKTFSKEKLPTLPHISIRLCTKEDMDRLPKIIRLSREDIKSKFRRDLEEGHIMIAAFLKGDIIGYAWHSCQKVYVPEIETWVDFDGVYGWRWFVMQKFREKGLGKELVKHFLKITEETFGKRKVYTIVDMDNMPAQRVLEAVGFKKQGIISYYRFFNLKRYREEKFTI